MCGIVGILAYNNKGISELTKTEKAVAQLLSRGPDGFGVYNDNHVALGHRRLSVIDTSDNAAQPMTDATARYIITFNGEIYNYAILRKELIDKGIVLKSTSDTEVLLYQYILYKEKCLEKLNGEFAFAIYDKKLQTLFLARDRFGIKPLYYYNDHNKFCFASELKGLMEFSIPKEVSQTALQTYLHLNYIPSPYSIYTNVYKLASGTYITIDNNNSSKIIHPENYYITPLHQSVNLSYADAQKKLLELVHNAVERRMVSDVPLGTFLSGGIDSSIITAIAALQHKNLATFSIGYKDEPLFDETYYAQLVAKKYKTEHTVFTLQNKDLIDHLHAVLDYIDEPFADSSALVVYILSLNTRKHVTVALSGDGADELFAGYNKHYAEFKTNKKQFVNTVLKGVHPLLNFLPKSRNSKLGNTFRQLEKYTEGLTLTSQERYWRWAGFYKEKELTGLLLATANDYPEQKKETLKFISDNFNTVLYTDIKLVLENDMLVKVDRMSMANSLEVRVPFMDHTIVDFAFTLPPHFKIDDLHRKKILKDTFRDYLPDELYNRSKKGFEVPLLKWLRTDLKSMIMDDLLNDKFISDQAIFNPEEIKKIKLQLFSNNPGDAVAKIWGLIVFQYWWKKHINS